MKRKVKSSRPHALAPRLRISSGSEVPLGPGKADLLELVAETGSIGEAAKRMDMSYMRAWTLIRTMNKYFKQPVILATRGGQSGGGAQVTETGRKALALYREMEQATVRATAGSWEQLRQLLRT